MNVHYHRKKLMELGRSHPLPPFEHIYLTEYKCVASWFWKLCLSSCLVVWILYTFDCFCAILVWDYHQSSSHAYMSIKLLYPVSTINFMCLPKSFFIIVLHILVPYFRFLVKMIIITFLPIMRHRVCLSLAKVGSCAPVFAIRMVC